MKKSIQLLCAVLVLFLGLSIALNFHLRHKLMNIPRETFIDTVKVSVPVPKDSVVIRYVTATLPLSPENKPEEEHKPSENVTDSISKDKTDSVKVKLPITQKVYPGEHYTAWVSGFMPSLDSIEVYAPTTVIEKDTPLIEWSVGLQLGMTWVPNNGLKPYAGIGVELGIPLRKFKKKGKHK